MIRDPKSDGFTFCFACVLAVLCFSRSAVGSQLDLIVALGPDELVFGQEVITVDDCVFANESDALWLLSKRSNSIYQVASHGKPRIYVDIDTLTVPSVRIGGMWGGKEKLYFSVSGPRSALLEYSTVTGKVREWPQAVGIYDLASGTDRTVVVPMSASAEESNRILIFGQNLQSADGWGERCPPEFDSREPILKLACLNKVAMDSGERLYMASLNTGRCEALVLGDLSVVPVRDADPGWSMPELSHESRLSTDTMLLDIAAGSTGDELFVLTSPKGIHGRRMLEVYRGGVLVGAHRLTDAFGAVVCGPGNRIALVKDEPPVHIAIFHYEVAP